MSDWATIVIYNSGLAQRVRKSSISAYGTDATGIAYVLRGATMVQVRQTEAELRAALEEE